MSGGDIADLSEKLSRTKVVDSGHLSFAGRGLKLNKASDADEIVAAIKQSKSLTALSLSGNTVGVEAAQAIAKALENHSNFQRALWSDIFTGRLKTEIPPSLNAFGAALILAGAQLVELDLSDNAFGPNGLAGLTDLLKSKSCFSLKELRLNNNGLGILGGQMLANSLLECYKNSCNAGSPLALRTFVSGRNRLENEGAKNLAEVFKAIGTLEELSMPQNGIQYPGIAALATALAVNKNLRILNLNDNTFTVKGATAVAAVLDKMPDLEVINFGDCLVRSEGASLLAEALSSNHVKLKHLILNGNEINSYAALKIIDSIENKTNLEKLDLDANQLGSDAVEMVKASMDSMNKQDALGSLSDDEGEEDDYKDDDAYDDIENEEDSEEEEDELTDDGEGEVVDDPNLEIKGKAIAPVKMAEKMTDDLLEEMDRLKLT